MSTARPFIVVTARRNRRTVYRYYTPSQAYAEFVAQTWREAGLMVRIRPPVGLPDTNPATTGGV
jgi:hypothetical protein